MMRTKTRLAKSRRRQRNGKRVAGTCARHAPNGDFMDSLLDASAQALGLTINPAWRDGVRFNLRLVLDHAARVEKFPLPADAEPAPVFDA